MFTLQDTDDFYKFINSLRDLVCIKMNKNTFAGNFFIHFDVFFVSFFSSSFCNFIF